MPMIENLINKFKTKNAKVGIIGLGYVGLPLALSYEKEGIEVTGFDIDESKIKKLSLGESYISHIDSTDIKKALAGKFKATKNFALIEEMDGIIICVPTPLDRHREPDLSCIISTMDSISPYLKKNQILSLESTTWPGTTDEVIKPYIEKRNWVVGEEYFLVFSPEREDPGRKDFTTTSTPKLCGGNTRNCLDMGLALYGGVIKNLVPLSSTKLAEITKLFENIHRAVNIALVNEMKVITDKMGLDVHEMIHAAATKPFGFTPYFPGPGIGGHCIPIDPFYLTWKVRELGVSTRFIELAGEVNNSMPDFVVGKIIDALNKDKKSLNGAKVLILGLSYKPNIDDYRESPALIVMEKLREKGAILSYSDPHLPTFPKMQEHHFDLQSIEVNPTTLQGHDCVVITTAHDSFDYHQILKFSQILVDTRGKIRESCPNLVRA